MSMRSKRKKIDITPADRGSFWSVLCLAAMALLLVPAAIAAPLPQVLSSANIPAVLLTCGLLSAVGAWRK